MILVIWILTGTWAFPDLQTLVYIPCEAPKKETQRFKRATDRGQAFRYNSGRAHINALRGFRCNP
jgi:hypothetical protein